MELSCSLAALSSTEPEILEALRITLVAGITLVLLVSGTD